jgi:hypothetical protein
MDTKIVKTSLTSLIAAAALIIITQSSIYETHGGFFKMTMLFSVLIGFYLVEFKARITKE